MVINNWGPVVKWFQDMWDKLKPIIEWFTDSSGDTVDAINSAQWGAGAYDAYGTGIRHGDTHLIRRWIRLSQTTPPVPQARIPS